MDVQKLEVHKLRFLHQLHYSFLVEMRSSSKEKANDLRNPLSDNISFPL